MEYKLIAINLNGNPLRPVAIQLHIPSANEIMESMHLVHLITGRCHGIPANQMMSVLAEFAFQRLHVDQRRQFHLSVIIKIICVNIKITHCLNTCARFVGNSYIGKQAIHYGENIGNDRCVIHGGSGKDCRNASIQITDYHTFELFGRLRHRNFVIALHGVILYSIQFHNALSILYTARTKYHQLI